MKDLVIVLIRQHRAIQKAMTQVLALSENAQKADGKAIAKALKHFVSLLTAHLKLENETFYVELLQKMESSGMETKYTQLFIDEMKDIEKVLFAFLGKFKDVESITEKIELFHKECLLIESALNLRVESEESGVYTNAQSFS